MTRELLSAEDARILVLESGAVRAHLEERLGAVPLARGYRRGTKLSEPRSTVDMLRPLARAVFAQAD